MRKVTTAVTQMSCSWDREKTLSTAEHLVKSAAEKGANIVLLQELFETPYFCQMHKFEYFNLAKTLEENVAVNHFKVLAIKLGIVIPVSFYEKSGNTAFNSVAVIDATGEILGIEKHIFQMGCLTQKNFILHREIVDLKCGIRHMER